MILRHLDLKFHRDLLPVQRAKVAVQQDPAVPEIYPNKKRAILFFEIALFLFSFTFIPELSDFLLDPHQSFAHQGLAKSLNISIGMPPIFAILAASRPWHISLQKIRFNRFVVFTFSHRAAFFYRYNNLK